MFANRFRSFMLLVLATVMLSACQQSSGPKIVTSGAWTRSSPSMAMDGAAYVLIENQGNQADRLIGASSPAAKTVELMESYMDNGMMGMRALNGGLEIPVGNKVELKPGGYHIMLMGLVKPLEAGTKIAVTLKFEKSSEITLDVEVRAQ